MRSLYRVAGRRTTQGFAAKVIGSIVKTLQQRYEFLKYVEIKEAGEFSEDEAIQISSEIDDIDRELVGRAIEAIVRVVYMDIIGKAGLFFIAELKRRASEDLIIELQSFGVDLASLQIEQHYLYRSRERKKRKSGRGAAGEVSLLGYTWKNVSSWKYDPSQKTCVLYSKDGDVLDNLHLDAIIESYVKNLSEDLEEIPEELEEKIDISDKEFQLLDMLRNRDMDAESAMNLLHVSKQEFESMVQKLLESELLQYTSYNVIELTEIGISYLSEKGKKEDTENEQVLEN
ncbi:MAG: hypothetical protein KAW45_02300 [Thermoplasmatales archaeon]|nr:hypothetical protein [Thermoplasmatales archaeon]